MKRKRSPALSGFFLVFAALIGGIAAAQEDASESGTPAIERIGEQRYRIGDIVVDKETAQLTVPATILHLDDPLEYLAVARGGMKDYESLLELSASATEFNLACILIGLDDRDSIKPRYQFDERTVEGMPVAVSLSWEQDGKTMVVSGANALSLGDEVFADDGWVYIGSVTGETDGRFMAEMTGTLIGFVHDPFSVIEHRNGGAIGQYGLLTGNNALLPPEGSGVTLIVSVVDP